MTQPVYNVQKKRIAWRAWRYSEFWLFKTTKFIVFASACVKFSLVRIFKNTKLLAKYLNEIFYLLKNNNLWRKDQRARHSPHIHHSVCALVQSIQWAHLCTAVVLDIFCPRAVDYHRPGWLAVQGLCAWQRLQIQVY